MTVSAATPSITYAANGVATVYAYQFKTFLSSHLVATLDGVTVTNYTVSGLGADGGGNLTFSPAPLGELVIRRVLPLSRSADYQAGGAFREDQVDQDQDIQTQQIQQIAEESGRALKVSPGNAATVDLEPIPGTFPAFDAGGGLFNAHMQTGSSIVDLVAATGSALVGFIQAGVSAIARSAQSKLRERVTPDDFGAVGDGVTDDTAALQFAMSNFPEVVLLAGKTYLCSKLNVTRDVMLSGSGTILHKANTAANGVGLIESLSDYKLQLVGITVDGNAANQTATAGTYNLVWNSIGSIVIDGCTIKNSKGHLVRSGNIDNFNASFFAHDVVIRNSTITNATSNCGDALRIERTRIFDVYNNRIYGGYSGVRTQLYCRKGNIYNNDAGYSYADVGVTIAMSEDMNVYGNWSHHHFQHGIEMDACVNSTVENNYCYSNSRSGIQCSEFGAAKYANSATYWGAISDSYGAAYSAQTYASAMVPGIGQTIRNNRCTNNGRPDRLIGMDRETLYSENYLNNPTLTGGYTGQLYIEGGTLNKTSERIFKNTFVPGSGNTSAIVMSNYQFDANIAGNTVIGNYPLANYAAQGMRNANDINRYLQDASKRSANLIDVIDTTSKTGFAVQRATAGNETFVFTGIPGSGAGYKISSFIAKVASGTQTAYIAANLYDSAGVFVATIASEKTITLTTTYTEFTQIINPSASVGASIRLQIRIPVTGVTLSIQEVNLWMVE